MPQFPGARLCAPLGAPAPKPADIDPEALAKALREARIGGSFWAGPGRLANEPEATFVSWPGHIPKRFERTAGSSCRTLRGEIDPWAILAQAARMIADPLDEWALLAAAAGVPVLARTTLRPLERSALLRALADEVTRHTYHCPYTGAGIDVWRWIDLLAEWRRLIDANAAIGPVLGIKRWKRPVMRQLLWAGRPAAIRRRFEPARAPAAAVAVWRSRIGDGTVRRIEAAGHRIAEIEDGFIRSAGLGTLLNAPFSITVDHTGVHYDPERPSDLETILATTDFDPVSLARAARLIDAISAARITKYAAGDWLPLSLPAGKRKVLVAGQVADDLSVLRGGGGIAGDLELLRRARADEPDACIVYKPHPDVVTGLRRGGVPREAALRHADLVVERGGVASLLDQVDAVHVVTSLTGFEALLRGCEVVTHGRPFYAGWGLTSDLAPPIARRNRMLSLEQLVAGALILYPRYLDPVTRLPCPAEVLVARLSKGTLDRTGPLQGLRLAQGRLTLVLHALAAHR